MSGALRAVLPGGIVLLAASAFLLVASETRVDYVASTYGLVVFGAGFALSWVFHRSRAFIVLGILAWLDITMVASDDRHATVVALGTVAIAMIGVLGALRDRGILSQVGLIQLLASSSTVAVASLYFASPERVLAFASGAETLAAEVPFWPPYPMPTLVAAGLALLAVAYGFHRYRGPVERSFVWSLVLLLVAMHPLIEGHAATLFVVAAGLTVTAGVVETSYVMAYRDELTGLPGRRALMQYLDGIQGTFAVAMVDVDHFKKFNDKHGHDVGDQVLKLVASRLARVKGGGKAYRYGGEEFTLLFPGRTVEQAMPHLEAVRESVEKARFALRSWKRPRKKPDAPGAEAEKERRPKTLSVTVSLGVADTESTPGDATVLLKKADEALYKAKKAGRNRVAT